MQICWNGEKLQRKDSIEDIMLCRFRGENSKIDYLEKMAALFCAEDYVENA